MRWEPNAEFQVSVEKPKVESVLRGEKVSLEEAKNRLKDATTNLAGEEPKDLSYFYKCTDEVAKELVRFENPVWTTYREVVRRVMDSELVHNWILVSGEVPKGENLRELIVRTGLVSEENMDEVFFRVEMFFSHSVDVEVLNMQLMVALNAKRSELGGPTFNKEEKIRLLETFENDHRLQELMVNALQRNTSYVDNLSADDKYEHDVDDFVNRLVMLSKSNDGTKEKIRSIFYDRETKMPKSLFLRSTMTVVSESLLLSGTYQKENSGSGMYLDSQLRDGCVNFLLRRAKKLEIVRLLLKIEKIQNESMLFELPKPNFYEIDAINEGNFCDHIDGSINWSIGNEISVDVLGEWFNLLIDSEYYVPEWSDGRNLREYKKLRVKPWIDAWSTMVHERAHFDFFNLYLDGNSKDEVLEMMNSLWVRAEMEWDYDPNIKQKDSFGVDSIKDKLEFSDIKYRTKLVSALSEGWTTLLEKLSLKYIYDNQEKFGGDLVDGDLNMIDKIRGGRVFDDMYSHNHYWLGQQIVGALFMDGYREDDDKYAELGPKETMKARTQKGVEKAKTFLASLDLQKIGDLRSRRKFEETRIEGENVVEVERKVWVEDNGVMKLIWIKDKKDRLLDYLCSTKPEKRKIGQKMFLELFGKDK